MGRFVYINIFWYFKLSKQYISGFIELIAAKEIYGYNISVYSDDLKLYKFIPTKPQSYAGCIRLYYNGSHYDCICFTGVGKKINHIPLEKKPQSKNWDINTRLYRDWFNNIMNKGKKNDSIGVIYSNNNIVTISDDDDIDILNELNNAEKKINIDVDIGTIFYKIVF